MREIKFRGKSIESGEFVYGHLAYSDNHGAVISTQAGGVPVYRDSVGQLTGLKDKNGKEIYEGDIVRTPSHPDTQVSDVFYLDGSFAIYLDGTTLYGSEDAQGRGWIEISQYSYSTDEDFEVIGNIYENPELIKEVK